jgi:phosphatidylglycerol lysyltransferase
MVAAASLYVVLPDSMVLSYPQFLGVYLLAVVAVILTHVPGGVGVLELIILTFAATNSKSEVLAALVAFRVIYYLLPLGLALALLLTYELRLQSEKAQFVARRVGTVLGGVTPMVVSLGTMLAGAVLLFSGATPSAAERLQVLHTFLPSALVKASHFLNSLIGGGLLLLGRGLQRRLDAAWWGAVVLLGAGVVVSLGKGFDYEEAIAASLVLAALIAARKQFYRKGSILHPAWSSGWIAAVAITLLCTIWLALFSHKHIEFDEQWWRFLFDPAAPRFLRALVGVAVLVVGFALAHMFFGRAAAKTTPATAAELEPAAQIVARSPRTSSNLALLGDKILLFNEEQTAFIMYGIQGRCWVAMGDPVGPEHEWSELVWEFREQCDRYDAWPVFYQVDPERVTLYLDQGYSLLKLGEEARVDASQFTLEGGARKGLRQNHNRFEKESFSFEIVARENVAGLLPTLKIISDEWLAEKQASEKGFSLGFFDENYLQRFPCAVIRSPSEVLAFANVWLAAGKEEFSIDLMRYRPNGPHGLMDYLFVKLLLWGRAEGYRWFNLGMAPLSGIESRQLAPLWNKCAALLFRHGDRFYGFEGLREYKDKFDPVWTPKYLAARGGLALPRILADVTTLIGKQR